MNEDVESMATLPSWVQDCASLSIDAKEALAALPDKLESMDPVRYLAGIGCEHVFIMNFSIILSLL